MVVDFRTCTSDEAAALLAPILRKIINETILPIIQERGSDQTGGWFAFWRGDPSGEILLPVVGLPAGLISPERQLKNIPFAHENAVRLGRNPSHISSFQSAAGGAIRIGSKGTRLLFSFSGFSEYEDEAICVILARRHSLLTKEDVLDLIRVSDNPELTSYLNRQKQGHLY